jgi:hypothetical protein
MRTLALLMSACAIAGVAHAEPGGVSSVGGANVTEGETRFEFRTATFDGGDLDGNWNHRAQVGHGFTDWWRGTLILRASQPDDESAEVTSVSIENLVEFTATHEWPVRLAGQFEYKFGVHGRDDEVEFKLIGEHSSGDFNARFNLIGVHTLNGDADWEPGYSARGMWRLSEQFSLGVEAFGETEVDAHYVGPRATLKLGNATIGFGYLAGYDDALADGQFRLGLEWAGN